MYVYLSVCLSIYLYVCPFICMYVHLSVCLSTHLDVCSFICMSVYKFISVYLFIPLSSYLFIYIFVYSCIYVEGVTLVLPSRFSCLTNIRENISYKVEYQLCETRSICTSMSITLKKKGQAFFPPLRAQKVT